jgi:hypothetical protein
MSKIKQYALGVLVLAIGAPIYMAVKHKMKEPAGATCTATTSCRGDGIFSSGMCLQEDTASYCTHECSSASDCSSGMRCEPVEGTWTETKSRGNHASQTRTSQGTKNVCVK